MDQDLIEKIQRLINILQTAQASFEAGAKGFEKLAASINVLDSALNNTSGIRNLQQYETQLDKFIQAVERGEKARISIRGQKVSTGAPAQTYQQYQQEYAQIQAGGVLSRAEREAAMVQAKVDAQKEELKTQTSLKGKVTIDATVAPEDTYKAREKVQQELAAKEAQVLKQNNATHAKAQAEYQAKERELMQQAKKFAEEQTAAYEANVKEQIRQRNLPDVVNATPIPARAEELKGMQSQIVQKYADEDLVQAKINQRSNTAKKAANDEAIRAEKLYQQQLEQLQQGNKALVKAEEEITNKRIANKREEVKAVYATQAELDAIQSKQKLATSLPGGAFAANAVLQKVQQVDPNMTADKIKDIYTETSTQISRVTFGYKTLEGANRGASVTVDRFGKVLMDTQKRFRDFGDAIFRDITELAKWSIAIAVIYGPMQKLNQLVTDSIDLQYRLSDVSVVLAKSTKTTADAFTSIYSVAQQTGEGVLDVVDAYTQAYRATGGIVDQTERFTKAQGLLRDSIVLSKLAGIEQTQAIDTLSAALRQTFGTGGLDRGVELLNKWVKTSRSANVDLETLAQSFSVVGEAADNAGISVDQLNAIVASIAEVSSSSAAEVATTAKAIITSFQSDAAKKQFDQLGIAYEDTTGKARNFLEIAKEVNDMVASGQMTAAQFSALTLAQGGGTRRQAPLQAFYASLPKLDEITKASAQADATTGEAYDALSKKTDNVRTSTERLNNAFINLANAMGDKGGLLEYTSGIVNGFTILVDAMSKVSDIGGKAIPILLAIGAAMLYINRQTQLWRDIKNVEFAQFIGKIAGGSVQKVSNAVGQNPVDSLTNANKVSQGTANFISGNSNRLAIGGAIAIPAISNLMSGNQGQAAGNVIGGAIVGTITKSPLGAIVGASIGEAFYTAVTNFKPDFKNLFADIFTPPGKPGETPTGSPEDNLRVQASQKSLEALGGGNATMGAILGLINQNMINFAGAVGLEGQGFKGVNQEQAVMLALEAQSRSPLSGIDTKAKEEAIKLLQQAQALSTGTTPAVEKERYQLAPDIKALQEQLRKQLQVLLASGQITTAKYTQGQEAVGNMNVSTPKFMAAYQGQFANRQEALNSIGKIQALGNPETLASLNTYAEQINAANEALAGMSATDEKYVPTLNARNEALRLSNALIQEQLKLLTEAKTLLGEFDATKYTQGQAKQILEAAQAETNARLSRNVAEGVITPEDAKTIKANYEKILILTKDSFIEGLGTTQEDLSKAMAKLLEAGTLPKEQTSIGFQQYDMSSQKFNQTIGMEQNAPGFQKFIDSLTALGYKEDKTDQIAILTDGTYKPVAKDWKLVEFYLSQIMKLNEKQVEGMYNFPEGSSAWIPASMLQFMNTTQDALNKLMGMGAPGTTTETTTQINPINSRGMATNIEEYNANHPQITKEDIAKLPDRVAEIYTRLQPQKETSYKPPATPTIGNQIVKEPTADLSTLPDRVAEIMGGKLKGTNAAPDIGTVIQNAFTGLTNTLSALLKMGNLGQAPNAGIGVGPGSLPSNPLRATGAASAGALNAPVTSAKITVDINSRSSLYLDGRIVADTVKRYMYADMVRLTTAGNAVKISLV